MSEPEFDRLVELLKETARAHHEAFAATDGVHAGWARWYAERLAPRIAEGLGLMTDVESLTAELVRCDQEYRDSGTEERWTRFYARRLLDILGA